MVVLDQISIASSPNCCSCLDCHTVWHSTWTTLLVNKCLTKQWHWSLLAMITVSLNTGQQNISNVATGIN